MAPKSSATGAFDEASWDSFDHEWEEVGDDNGEIITFEKDTVMFGIFVEKRIIELPPEKVNE
ncbi:MAG: hypothetical protein KGL39_52870, partial [Patescibacteria group bacterium]|nr:hypothetical protein [Patescibacteria group bacterium]